METEHDCSTLSNLAVNPDVTNELLLDSPIKSNTKTILESVCNDFESIDVLSSKENKFVVLKNVNPPGSSSEYSNDASVNVECVPTGSTFVSNTASSQTNSVVGDSTVNSQISSTMVVSSLDTQNQTISNVVKNVRTEMVPLQGPSKVGILSDNFTNDKNLSSSLAELADAEIVQTSENAVSIIISNPRFIQVLNCKDPGVTADTSDVTLDSNCIVSEKENLNEVIVEGSSAPVSDYNVGEADPHSEVANEIIYSEAEEMYTLNSSTPNALHSKEKNRPYFRSRADLGKVAATRARRITAKMKAEWNRILEEKGLLKCPLSGCFQKYRTMANFLTHYKYCYSGMDKDLKHCPYCASVIFSSYNAVLHHMKVEHPDKLEEYKTNFPQPDDVYEGFEEDNSRLVENSQKSLKNHKRKIIMAKENRLSPKKRILKSKFKTINQPVVENSQLRECGRFDEIVSKISSVNKAQSAAERDEIKLNKERRKRKLILTGHVVTPDKYFEDERDGFIDIPMEKETAEGIVKVNTKSRLVLNMDRYKRYTQYLTVTRDFGSHRRTYSRPKSSNALDSSQPVSAQNDSTEMDIHQLNSTLESSTISLSENDSLCLTNDDNSDLCCVTPEISVFDPLQSEAAILNKIQLESKNKRNSFPIVNCETMEEVDAPKINGPTEPPKENVQKIPCYKVQISTVPTPKIEPVPARKSRISSIITYGKVPDAVSPLKADRPPPPPVVDFDSLVKNSSTPKKLNSTGNMLHPLPVDKSIHKKENGIKQPGVDISVPPVVKRKRGRPRKDSTIGLSTDQNLEEAKMMSANSHTYANVKKYGKTNDKILLKDGREMSEHSKAAMNKMSSKMHSKLLQKRRMKSSLKKAIMCGVKRRRGRPPKATGVCIKSLLNNSNLAEKPKKTRIPIYMPQPPKDSNTDHNYFSSLRIIQCQVNSLNNSLREQPSEASDTVAQKKNICDIPLISFNNVEFSEVLPQEVTISSMVPEKEVILSASTSGVECSPAEKEVVIPVPTPETVSSSTKKEEKVAQQTPATSEQPTASVPVETASEVTASINLPPSEDKIASQEKETPPVVVKRPRGRPPKKSATPQQTKKTVETPMSAVETPMSAVETPMSAVGTPMSAVETPMSAVETPKSVEETPKSAVEILKSVEEAPKSTVETLKSVQETPKSAVETLKSVETPKSAVETPKSVEVTPKSVVETPKSIVETPKSDQVSTPTLSLSGVRKSERVRKRKLGPDESPIENKTPEKKEPEKEKEQIQVIRTGKRGRPRKYPRVEVENNSCSEPKADETNLLEKQPDTLPLPLNDKGVKTTDTPSGPPPKRGRRGRPRKERPEPEVSREICEVEASESSVAKPAGKSIENKAKESEQSKEGKSANESELSVQSSSSQPSEKKFILPLKKRKKIEEKLNSVAPSEMEIEDCICVEKEMAVEREGKVLPSDTSSKKIKEKHLSICALCTSPSQDFDKICVPYKEMYLDFTDVCEIYPTLKPDVNEYQVFSNKHLWKDYLEASVSIKGNKTDNWMRLKCFDSVSMDDSKSSMFFTGGPVQSSAFCPIPSHMDQYVAVASSDILYNIKQERQNSISYVDAKNDKGLIQFWNLGRLQSAKLNRLPCMELALEHQHGIITEMKWCPKGCYDLPLSKDGAVGSRLGLLALSCSDSYVRIYSVPHPNILPKTDENATIYNTRPSLILTPLFSEPCNLTRRSLATCLDWHQNAEVIAAGYGNGCICVWMVKIISAPSATIVTMKNEDQSLSILPYLVFDASGTPITSISFAPLDNCQYLASSSFDKTLKFFDLHDTSIPFCSIKRGFAHDCKWAKGFCGSVVSLHDGHTFKGSSFAKECGTEEFTPLNTAGTVGSLTCSAISDLNDAQAIADIAGTVSINFFHSSCDQNTYSSSSFDMHVIFETEVVTLDQNERIFLDKAVNSEVSSVLSDAVDIVEVVMDEFASNSLDKLHEGISSDSIEVKDSVRPCHFEPELTDLMSNLLESVSAIDTSVEVNMEDTPIVVSLEDRKLNRAVENEDMPHVSPIDSACGDMKETEEMLNKTLATQRKQLEDSSVEDSVSAILVQDASESVLSSSAPKDFSTVESDCDVVLQSCVESVSGIMPHSDVESKLEHSSGHQQSIESNSNCNTVPQQSVESECNVVPQEPVESESSVVQQPCESESSVVLEPMETESSVVQQLSESECNVVPQQPVESESCILQRPCELEFSDVQLPMETESCVVLHPMESESSVVPQPMESESSVVPEPMESESSVVQQPSESESSVVQQPSESESSVVQQPSESESSVVQQPSESESSVVQQPSEFESSVVQQPCESESSAVQQPCESESSAVQQSIESEHGDVPMESTESEYDYVLQQSTVSECNTMQPSNESDCNPVIQNVIESDCLVVPQLKSHADSSDISIHGDESNFSDDSLSIISECSYESSDSCDSVPSFLSEPLEPESPSESPTPMDDVEEFSSPVSSFPVEDKLAFPELSSERPEENCSTQSVAEESAYKIESIVENTEELKCKEMPVTTLSTENELEISPSNGESDLNHTQASDPQQTFINSNSEPECLLQNEGEQKIDSVVPKDSVVDNSLLSNETDHVQTVCTNGESSPTNADSSSHVLESDTVEELATPDLICEPQHPQTSMQFLENVDSSTETAEACVSEERTKELVPEESPVSYASLISSCGLIFKDVNTESTSSDAKKDSPCIEKESRKNVLSSVNTISWNPNYGCHFWLVTGGNSGIARLVCVSELSPKENTSLSDKESIM